MRGPPPPKWRAPPQAPYEGAPPPRQLPLGWHPLIDLIRLVELIAYVQRDIVRMTRMSLLFSAWACALAAFAFWMAYR